MGLDSFEGSQRLPNLGKNSEWPCLDPSEELGFCSGRDLTTFWKFVFAKFPKTLYRITRYDQGAKWEPSQCCILFVQQQNCAVSGESGPYMYWCWNQQCSLWDIVGSVQFTSHNYLIWYQSSTLKQGSSQFLLLIGIRSLKSKVNFSLCPSNDCLSEYQIVNVISSWRIYYRDNLR